MTVAPIGECKCKCFYVGSVKRLYLLLGHLDSLSFCRQKHITSLKNQLSLVPGKVLPYWFRGNFCGRVCFDLLVERIFFLYSTNRLIKATITIVLQNLSFLSLLLLFIIIIIRVSKVGISR